MIIAAFQPAAYKRSLMNIRQLECFQEVARTLNFTKAAQNLFLSQTVVTNHIRHLEESVGFSVFERSKKAVSLTENGALLLKEAQKVLESAASCQNLAQQLKTGLAGKIRLAYIIGIEQCILTRIIGDFYQKHPDIQLELSRDNWANMQNMLLRNEVDGIFISRPELTDCCETMLLQSFPLLAAVSAKHPIAEETSVTYLRLCQETNIIFDAVTKKTIMPDLDNSLLRVSINSGAMVIPKFVVNYSSCYEKYIRYLPLTDIDISFDVCFAYSKSNQNRSLQLFADNTLRLLSAEAEERE